MVDGMMVQLYEQEQGDALEQAYERELHGKQERVCELELDEKQGLDELEQVHESGHDQYLPLHDLIHWHSLLPIRKRER